MKVFFLISTRIFHILTQKSPIFFLSEMCKVIFCVTTKNLTKFLLKIFFPVTISLDTEQTKKFRQSFIELKPSTL